jgi:hypothetical protein
MGTIGAGRVFNVGHTGDDAIDAFLEWVRGNE